MVNGTKLLNVAGMTRGRRDGILKSEKQKHVVKIGPMHLKGVWYVSSPSSPHFEFPPSKSKPHHKQTSQPITQYPNHDSNISSQSRIPFERALEFANREKITEMLYPLFVHNIGALLYHPINRGYPAAAQIPRSQEPSSSSQAQHMAGMADGNAQGPVGQQPVPQGQRYDYEGFQNTLVDRQS